MSELRDRVQRQFGAHAQNYVTSKDHAEGESLDRLVALLPWAPGWRALDVATGGGHTALAIAPHVAEVVASDLTPAMLAAAEVFLRGRSLTNVAFETADACALPFEAAAFDLVTCRLAAHHFPDCDAFVRETARVLRPGGWLALIDNVTPPEPRAARFVNAFEKLRDPSHAWEYAAVDWEAFCQAAGFRVHLLEHYRKPLQFEPWCDRMSVPARTRQQLRLMLFQAPTAGRDALQPAFHGDPLIGPIEFSLGEILLLAQLPA